MTLFLYIINTKNIKVQAMLDYYLLFKGDILFVSLLTIIYFLYSYIKKIQTDQAIRYVLVFVFAFYWFLFLLKIRYTVDELQGLAGFIIIPLFTLYYLFIPIKKSTYIKKVLWVLLAGYILFWLILTTLYRFSNM